MSAVQLPPPPTQAPIATAGGAPSMVWASWFNAAFQRLGGAFDKVDAAYAAALAAVPQTRQIVGSGGLKSIGPSLAGNVGVVLYKVVVPVASLPTSGNTEGDWSYATNGRKPGEGAGSGTGVPVFWSNGNWVAVTSGATVTS